MKKNVQSHICDGARSIIPCTFIPVQHNNNGVCVRACVRACVVCVRCVHACGCTRVIKCPCICCNQGALFFAIITHIAKLKQLHWLSVTY